MRMPADEQGIFIRPDCFGTVERQPRSIRPEIAPPPTRSHYLNLKRLRGRGLENPRLPIGRHGSGYRRAGVQLFRFTGGTARPPIFSCGTADMFMNFMNARRPLHVDVHPRAENNGPP